MKKALCLLFILSVYTLRAFAEQKRAMGFGITAANLSGPTLDTGSTKRERLIWNRLQHDGIFMGIICGWLGINSPQEAGKVGLYAGLGARIENVKHNDNESRLEFHSELISLFNQVPLSFLEKWFPCCNSPRMGI